MNLVLDINQFNINDVHYQEAVKNTIMDNSKFIRIIYSNSLFMLNGIFIRFILNISHVEKSFNKYKCFIDRHTINNTNNEIIAIGKIERELLEKVTIKGKNPVYRINEQIMNGHIKIFIDNGNKLSTNEFILKISGICENETDYGVTYRFSDDRVATTTQVPTVNHL